MDTFDDLLNTGKPAKRSASRAKQLRKTAQAAQKTARSIPPRSRNDPPKQVAPVAARHATDLENRLAHLRIDHPTAAVGPVETDEPRSLAAAHSVELCTATVRPDRYRDGIINISFSSIPGWDIRDELKAAHYRWNAADQVWHGQADGLPARYMRVVPAQARPQLTVIK